MSYETRYAAMKHAQFQAAGDTFAAVTERFACKAWREAAAVAREKAIGPITLENFGHAWAFEERDYRDSLKLIGVWP